MSVNFDASDSLYYLINPVKNNLIKNFFINLLIIIVFSILLYYALDKIVDSAYIIAQIFLVIIIAWIDRSKSVSTGLTISRTATEVSIIDNEIMIKTTPFKVLFWINKPSVELKFKVGHFSHRKISYPVKAVYDLNIPVWQLTNENGFVYIISGLFAKELDGELQRLLT